MAQSVVYNAVHYLYGSGWQMRPVCGGGGGHRVPFNNSTPKGGGPTPPAPPPPLTFTLLVVVSTSRPWGLRDDRIPGH